MVLNSTYYRGFIVLLAIQASAALAQDKMAPTQGVERVTTAVRGVSAPFVVDVTTLFTNDIHVLDYKSLTNMLDEARLAMTDTGKGMPDRRAAERTAKLKALKESPAIQDIRKQINELKKKADDLAAQDPGYLAAKQALEDAQHDLITLTKKIELLSKEVWLREQHAQEATGTETNKP